MFKLIEPQDHKHCKHRIELFLKQMRIQQDIHLTSEEYQRSTLILAEDEEGEPYGGAILWQRHVRALQPQIRDVVSTFLPSQKEVWGGVVCLFPEKGDTFSKGETNVSFQTFYQDILDPLVDFGVMKESHFLCLTLNPMEYLKTKKKGFWPYLFEVNPQSSLDSLFHGILPLTAMARKPSWQERL